VQNKYLKDKKIPDYDKFIAEEDQKIIRGEHNRALANARLIVLNWRTLFP